MLNGGDKKENEGKDCYVVRTTYIKKGKVVYAFGEEKRASVSCTCCACAELITHIHTSTHTHRSNQSEKNEREHESARGCCE